VNRVEIEKIGWRLREIRVLLRIRTQIEFGKLLGLGSQTIGSVERGRNLPTGEFCTALAEQDINLNYLFTGKGPVFVGDKRDTEARLALDSDKARGRAGT
jgi:DNA-binding XRE family transcriptional regulator